MFFGIALKHLSSTIVPFLCAISNKCVGDGIYPNGLKTAKVTAIFKSGNSCYVMNYRLISVLPAINKIFEKLTSNCMLFAVIFE